MGKGTKAKTQKPSLSPNQAHAAPTVLVKRVPTDVPFTLKQLREAIPAHCFERSTARSMLHLAFNSALVALTYYASTFIESALPTVYGAQYVAWVLYWVVQGCLCTGLWVLAHEAGHRAFSPSNLVNDAVGLVVHSALLVPYHPWRISHGKHHGNTNHIDRDEVFVPGREPVSSFITETWMGRVAGIVIMLTLGWPAYLVANIAGRPYPRWANHFLPSSPVFSKNQKWDVIVSDLALVITVAALGYLGSQYGFGWLAMVYGVPYLIVNFWLVLITYLQHSDLALPHYDNSEWTYVRGALCTVDRDYGILNHVFHHIGDTHVAHHLFSQMPFYHAEEATRALKSILGPYYLRDTTPIAIALWRSFNNCDYVAPDATTNSEGILWYHRVPSSSEAKSKSS